tara:strand:- start:266 stop:2965 length:2700 start_codon:yes stop_codon:yes gene_type:complete
MSMQQMLLGAGAKKKTYIEDVFKVHLYEGNATANRDIVNGIDLAGDGGMVWTKNWDNSSYGHNIFDTKRGATKMLTVSNNNAEANETNTLTQFNSNGFRINGDNNINKDDDSYVSYSFKKTPGFFDCVKFTGNDASSRDISHNLGCRPGMIILRNTDGGNWWTYHHEVDVQENNANWSMVLSLNLNGGRQNNIENIGSDATHTATTFRVGSGQSSNSSGVEYIAYLFAGSYNTGVTNNKSIKCTSDASNHYIGVSNSTDYNISTGDWTIEMFVKQEGSGNYLFSSGKDGNSYEACLLSFSDNRVSWYVNSTSGWSITDTIGRLAYGTWHHIAVTRNGNVFRAFLDGVKTFEETHNITLNNNSGDWVIGGRNGSGSFRGNISNFRYTKGQALYTASFTPTKEPFTTTSQGATSSNVKMLCCNGSTTTSSTVVSGTLSETGTNWTASDQGPFPDPKASVFGEGGDQDIIKVGHYAGQSDDSEYANVHLGWEPQFLMIKGEDMSEDWQLFDHSRGSFAQRGVNQRVLRPNENSNEDGRDSWLEVTPTGFRLTSDTHEIGKNQYGSTLYKYIYIAIRRPDTLVTKAPEAGTEVFGMDTAASSTPKYNAGFEMDLFLKRKPDTTNDWRLSTRLSGYKVIRPNLENAKIDDSSSIAWNNHPMTKFNGGGGDDHNDHVAWMWRRYAGLDIVLNTRPDNYKSTQHVDLRHNLGKAPEMIWIKNPSLSAHWYMWHKDMNGGGTDALGYYAWLDHDEGAVGGEDNYGDSYSPAVDFLPTATHWRCGSDQNIRHNQSIAFLFASVSGISKIGSFTGNGSSAGPTISCGFEPRFVMLKNLSYTSGCNAVIFDQHRGPSNFDGDEKKIFLNSSAAQNTVGSIGISSGSGFNIQDSAGDINRNGDTIMYWAHA